jgi:hypothetical protein
MKKIIFILWLQGYEKAPLIVNKCVKSWKYYNKKTWKIVLLSKKNLHHYVPFYLNYRHINKTALSDIIRIALLFKYGGLWVDATTFCNKSLDDWLPKLVEPPNEFFAFYKPSPDKQLSSWFLYFNNPFHYISKVWLDATLQYFTLHKEPIEYFWFHCLFNDLVKKNIHFQKLWDLVPKISSNGPHFLQSKGLMTALTPTIKKHIDVKVTPLYKLTYRCKLLPFNKNLILYYLFSLIN